MEHTDYVVIKPGTEVTRKILDNLSSPDDALKIIHIAGTNGKGSIAEYFTQILIAAGKTVGTFTSPQVYDFYDQFRINGKIIPPEKAERYFGKALKAAEGLGATDFEIQTAGVMLAFKEEGCEYAVIECGMGGLNDATNAINKKELAVISSVSLEHTQYLGNTVEEICEQKAGIIKGGCRVIINGYQPSETAKKYFLKLGGYFADGITFTGGNTFIYRGKQYEAPNGFAQIYNAAVAIEGATILNLPQSAVSCGINNTSLRGRLEKFTACGRDYILDGAHNPAALKQLADCLGDITGDAVTVIFGCLKDKDIDGNLAELARFTKRIIAVECDSPRKMPLKEIRETCKKYFRSVSAAESVTDALNVADGKTVVVCGSFTLLKEAKEWIEKKQ